MQFFLDTFIQFMFIRAKRWKKVENWDTYFHETSFNTMDAKGRIAIPVRFRDTVRRYGDKLVLTGMDLALNAYPPEVWTGIEARMEALDATTAEMRRFRRQFVGRAVVSTTDKQSRILISPSLRKYADLQKEVVIVGQLDHFQIWSLDRYEADSDLAEQDVLTPELSGQISKLRL